ncbi:MAG: hypothetical protein JO013_05890 [Alphaproteobacteria bacterium]|nr:hypothetical protein [Alphaproteobacteria bacterium]
MIGFRRARPVRLIPFAEAKPLTFNELLCDGVTARSIPCFADLLDLHARLQRERPHQCILASLDDLGQACYTSGHGTDHYGLDDVEGLDEEQPTEFPVRLTNLLKRAEAVDVRDVAGLLDWATPGDSNDLLTVNRDPDRALRIAEDGEVIFQFVPVSSPAEAIAAFPNGYFSADLNPMQNLALARHLESAYGLTLFGIGSRFLGFRRCEALEEAMARDLAAELARFYRGAPPGAAAELARLIAGREWLLLRYTES